MSLRRLGLPGLVMIVICCVIGLAAAADSPATKDPVGLFLKDGESWDEGDFFIHGKENTILFRVLQDINEDGVKDMALSEISTWGNQTGSWVTFMGQKDGTYVRDPSGAGLKFYPSLREWCATRDYAKQKECTWKKGHPPADALEQYAPFTVPHRLNK